MTEQDQISPGGGDPFLDEQLLMLKRFTPIVGFEDRVLARVWRPAPIFVLIWKDRIREWATPGRRWAVAAAASFGSLVSTIGLAAWVNATGRVPAQQALAWAAGAANRFTSDGIENTVVSWMPAVAGYLTVVPAASLSRWASVAVAAALAPVISLAGLYLVARRPASERVRSYASR